ncbi:MAG: serine hydrolase domain-containing protein [Propionibacteriaceae bacterium]
MSGFQRAISIAAIVAIVSGCAVDISANPTQPEPTQMPSTISVAESVIPNNTVHPKSAELQKVLTEGYEAGWFPNAIVGVWSPQGSWVGTIGDNAGTPVTADLYTRIASVTKTFTTTVLLQLANEKKLSLDDPLNKWVSDVPNSHATLKQLANMTSGIPCYTQLDSYDAAVLAHPQREWTPEELVSQLKGQQPLFDPGQYMYYSNSNTVLLGIVIEKVTGKKLANVIKERIITPLHLKNTSFPSDNNIPAPFLHGTSNLGTTGGPVIDTTNFSPSVLAGAGAMISTLDDMHTWAVALGTGKGILDEKSQQNRIESLKPTVSGNYDSYSYGLGIIKDRNWIGHTGELAGYTTVVEYKPDTQTSIVIFCGTNIYADNVERPASALFDGYIRVLG